MVAEGNIGLGFAMVSIAGAASMIGFLPVLFLKKMEHQYLAFALAFAAGLMIFISLVEILVQGSIENFVEAGYSDGASIRYGMLLFYAGCILVFLLDHSIKIVAACKTSSIRSVQESFNRFQKLWKRPKRHDRIASVIREDAAQPASDKEHVKTRERISAKDETSMDGTQDLAPRPTSPEDQVEEGRMAKASAGSLERPGEIDTHILTIREDGQFVEAEECAKIAGLKRMSLLVCCSMAIHNLPEGMAVFLGTLQDTKFGVAIAIAIAVHNIPEGFCISFPVYYATGSQWKAFVWTLIPSLAEPLGGLLAYAIFHEANDLSFAIAFGLVAGIMTYVSVMELLPAAFAFDHQNKVVTWACLLGMFVMALSFILLSL